MASCTATAVFGGWRKVKQAIDTHAVTDLILFAESDGGWHKYTYMATKCNLARRMRAGTYDPVKAAKLWGYAFTDAAHRYKQAYGSFVPRGMQAAVVREAARQFEEQERATLLEDL